MARWCARKARRARGFRARTVDALGGAWVTPGLIDCHTHLVFGGTRADEHAMRRAGATYEEIAVAGGGISATVKRTAAASDEELLEQSRRRLNALMRGGCTTVEIKSGYGLDPESELQAAQDHARAWRRRGGADRPNLAGAPCASRGPARPARALCRRNCRQADSCGCKAGPRDQRRCILAKRSPSRPRKWSACSRPRPTTGFEFASTPNNCRTARRRARGQISRIVGRSSRTSRRSGSEGDGRCGNGRRTSAGAFYALQETTKPPIAMLRKHKVAIAIATDCNPELPRCSRRLWR